MVLLSLGAGALVACAGTDYRELCERQRACIGGNDRDLEACVATCEYGEQVADIQGCSDEYVDAMQCIYQYASCEAQKTGYRCVTDQECPLSGAVRPRCQEGECVLPRYAVKDENACRAAFGASERCSALEAGELPF